MFCFGAGLQWWSYFLAQHCVLFEGRLAVVELFPCSALCFVLGHFYIGGAIFQLSIVFCLGAGLWWRSYFPAQHCVLFGSRLTVEELFSSSAVASSRFDVVCVEQSTDESFFTAYNLQAAESIKNTIGVMFSLSPLYLSWHLLSFKFCVLLFGSCESGLEI